MAQIDKCRDHRPSYRSALKLDRLETVFSGFAILNLNNIGVRCLLLMRSKNYLKAKRRLVVS